jgi:arabinose-5-phosphate isomerase
MTNPKKADRMDDGATDADTAETAGASDLAAARRVLRLEAEALRAMSDALDGGFTQAVEILFAVSGRVVVTGMGKSGHIARKISATLASTGTPSWA